MTPILFVGNTADNITPLRNAYKNAKGFRGSVVLRQDSVGHTSLSMPSRCTAMTIREYFQEGSMPEIGKVCAGDLVLFQPWNETLVESSGGDKQEELNDAPRELAKKALWGV